jgi:HK97 family phage major capsid protein/HK97 family phage prohead protease
MPAVADKPVINLADPRLRELRREITFKREAIDTEKRTVDLAFASEVPVERYFGNEVLACNSRACDMTRLNDGAPLLWNHDPANVIGVVERATMEADKIGRASVRFSKSPEAQQYFQDVQDGILRKVSVGYRVKSMKLRDSNDAGDTYEVDGWEPYEISLVSLPADNSVGVGRSATEPATKPIIKMSEVTPAAAAAVPPPVDVQAAINSATGIEATRCSEILAISDQFKVPVEKRNEAIKNKTSLESFRQYVMNEVIKAPAIVSSPDIGMDKRDLKQYSLLRAINTLANGKSLQGTLEGEASDAAAKQYKRESQGSGFIIPHDMSQFASKEVTLALMRQDKGFAKRALESSVFTGAGAFVQTDVLGGSLIELLRNKTLLNSLGCINLTGLQGNVAIPKQTAAATSYWLDEATAVTRSQQTVGQVGLTPKRLSAGTAYTKQFLAQSSIDPEAFVRNDLMQILAIAKDLAGIAGQGGSQPLGIVNTPSVNTVTFSGAADLAHVLSFETKIMTANADIGSMNWLTNITVRNKWKQIAQLGTTFPIFLCGPDNKANGYAMNVSNQVPITASVGSNSFTVDNQVIFGAFNQAIMADWAGMDVVVDPYSLALQNQVAITVCILTDFAVRHAASFAVSTDSGAQ